MTSRIFLVEDNTDIRHNLSLALAEVADAVVVSHAPSQSAAVTWLKNNPHAWDVVVLDLFLTEGSGFGVVQACRARQSHQRVVVLSNYADVSAPDVLAQGADAVFDKADGLDDFFEYIVAGQR